jgi:glycerol-3-phosphate dehydrogenase
MSKPRALIIGAGFTGVAVAHDLALRGFDVTVVDRGDVITGTSGRTHGLLHSGGRYCVNDAESAVECIDENTILRKIMPQCIEPNGGLFIALNDSDLAYAERFTEAAEACHIPIDELKSDEVLRLEPNVNRQVLVGFMVPDGTFDPLRFALAFAATAKANGARFRLYTEVKSFLMSGTMVTGVHVWDRNTGLEEDIYADVVINAGGPWSGGVAAMAGANVPIRPTPGVMVAYDQRFVNRAINRLNKPGDGDIVLPQRRMVVVGTTSFEVKDPDYVPVTKEQVQMMLERGSALVPAIAQAKMRGAFMATRPLIDSGGSGRSLSRTFECFDHQETDGVGGLVTIAGGKATTSRAMAEKAADVVCQKLGVSAQCVTKEVPLRSYREFYVR